MATNNGIDFNRTFGAGSGNVGGNAGNGNNRQDLPKANAWLNIGYTVEVETEAGIETRFVSMPVGIPVDTQEKLPVTSNNENFRNFQGARNELLDQIQQLAASLNPGEERTLNLEIQLRRVNDTVAPPATGEANPFAKPINLVG